MATITTSQSFDNTADIIIIGYGIAGACAALEASRAGCSVLIIERASGGGGSSALSGGIFYLGGGTPVQEACGYADSATDMYNYIAASMEPLDDSKARLYADNSVEHFHWLEAQGVPFERSAVKGKRVVHDGTECLMVTGNEKVWPYPEIAAPVPRGHKVAAEGDYSGSVAMAAILNQCERCNPEIIYDTALRELLIDAQGRVIGITAFTAGAGLVRLGANKAVILATGGFNMNLDLIRSHNNLINEVARPLGVPANDGAGLEVAVRAGAATEAMDGIIATASIYPPEQLIKGIIVNKLGERFVAEDAYHGRTASFVMEQPDQRAYLIVDEEIFAYPLMVRARHQLIDGWDTIEDMEAGLGLPDGSLVNTLSNYNGHAAQGIDPEWHKQKDWLKPLIHGPYAAFDISFNKSEYSYMTLGGILTNKHSQVLNTEGEVIQGFYAAGACTSHIPRSGKSYCSGMSLGPGSYFGRVAGQHAAARG